MVPRGMLTLLCGLPGVGKSLLTCRWAAQLASRGEITVLVSAEDSPGHVTKPRLIALEADESHVIYSPALPIGNGAFPWFVDRVAESHASLLVLDPFTAMMAEEQSSWSDHHVRRALAPLADLAQTLDVAIVYILHLNKTQSSDPLMRVGGSIAFTAAARSGILVGIDPDDDTSTVRLVGHMKCNVSEIMPTQQWRIRPIQLDDELRTKTARLDYEGHSTKTPIDMLAPVVIGEERSEIERASEIIQGELAFGSIPSRDLEKSVTETGLSHRTYDRARQKVGVRAVKKGSVWHTELVTKEGRQGGLASLDVASLIPMEESGVAPQSEGRTPFMHERRPSPERVSQSPPVQGSLDWIGTASWNELQKGLTDTGTSDTVET